jgi:transposase
METITRNTQQASHPPTGNDVERLNPFSQEWVTITKEEHIDLIHRASYWEAQFTQLKQKFAKAEAESQRKDAKIKDLQNRLFGKKSEKPGSTKSEKGDNPTSERKRGQQPGRGGHGRTPRPDLASSRRSMIWPRIESNARVAACRTCQSRDSMNTTMSLRWR